MTPGTATADDEEYPDVEWMAAFGSAEPSLITGTAIDEFTPIYRALSRETQYHGAFSPDEIDRWDLTTVAVVMGRDAGDAGIALAFKSWETEYEQWKTTEGAARGS